MRFMPYIVFARLCGAAGLGVLLGAAVAGFLGLLTGSVFTQLPHWPLGAPVLAILGAPAGLLTGWLTRRWFVPTLARRRMVFTLGGMAAVPLATAVPSATIMLAFLIMLVTVSTTVTLWVRGYRRETAQVRALMFGYRNQAR